VCIKMISPDTVYHNKDDIMCLLVYKTGHICMPHLLELTSACYVTAQVYIIIAIILYYLLYYLVIFWPA